MYLNVLYILICYHGDTRHNPIGIYLPRPTAIINVIRNNELLRWLSTPWWVGFPSIDVRAALDIVEIVSTTHFNSVRNKCKRTNVIHLSSGGCLPELVCGCREVGRTIHVRVGVLNRGEISPMGEILGIQGGNESVWKLLSFQNWWHKMVPLVYFWWISFSHSNTMPFNSRLAVIEINRYQWCHHIAILRYVRLGKGGNNSLVVAKVGKLEKKGKNRCVKGCRIPVLMAVLPRKLTHHAVLPYYHNLLPQPTTTTYYHNPLPIQYNYSPTQCWFFISALL